MTFNRAKIMQAAWTIARRFAGNRETWGQRLSRALKFVWWDAKQAARAAANAAREAAAKAARFAVMTADQLSNAVVSMENTDRLGWAGIQELSEMRAAYTARLASTPALAA
jgi:hypothetical protein